MDSKFDKVPKRFLNGLQRLNTHNQQARYLLISTYFQPLKLATKSIRLKVAKQPSNSERSMAETEDPEMKIIKINSRNELEKFILSCDRFLALAADDEPVGYLYENGFSKFGVLQEELLSDNFDLISLNKSVEFLFLDGLTLNDTHSLEIGKLEKLIWLDLDNNSITESGTIEIAKLKNLTVLHLNSNSIKDAGATEIAKLKNLTELTLDNNSIEDIGATEIAKLKKLTKLDLDNNSIGDTGATEIAKLKKLTTLFLHGNAIGGDGGRKLLNAFQNSSIVKLYLTDNPLCNELMNAEDFESDSAASILSAWASYKQAIEDGSSTKLNEAKLLVVGNEEVGKTSLIKFIVDGKPIPKNGRPETKGIDQYPQISTRNWHDHCDIKLNIWDFGGQQIYHGTHRYFLTSRSLYLMVLQDRRNDDERTVYSWLRTIQSVAGDAPVIIIINKSDEGKENLNVDEADIQLKFPQVCGFLRTSCENKEWARQSIKKLKQLIVDTLQTSEALSSIRNDVPGNWHTVKEYIRKTSSNARVMEMTDFGEICVNPNIIGDKPIIDKGEQEALLRQLDQLGIIIAHGLKRDAPAVFKQISLLDPNWLTDAIYRIIDCAKLEEVGGSFTRSDLEKWLDPDIYPIEHHEFVLTMMQDKNLDLCFELPNKKGNYLAPEALPRKAVNFGAFRDGSLQFRYKYTYLQRAVIPRMIVRMHEYLQTPNDAWLGGAMLKIRDCDVLITSDSERHEINIAVKGDQHARDALLIAREAFEKVHSLYKDLDVNERVPLPDQPDVTASYNFLIKMEIEHPKGFEFPIEGGEGLFTAHSLLEHVGRLQTEPDKSKSYTKQGILHRPHFEPQSTQPAPTATPVTTGDNTTSATKRFEGWLIPAIAALLAFLIATFEFDLSILWSCVAALSVFVISKLIARIFDRGFLFRKIFATWFSSGLSLLVVSGPLSASFETGSFQFAWGSPPSTEALTIWIVGAFITAALAFWEARPSK